MKMWRFLVLLLWAAPTWALDVSQAGRVEANTALWWCATQQDTTLNQVLQGACTPKLAGGADLHPGFDTRAFWLRLNLDNPSNQTLERWLAVGHPRLEFLSLFVPDGAGGWNHIDSGLGIPMAARADIPRLYGALPVVLPAQTQQTVWLRVASRNSVDLGTTVWSPAQFQRTFGVGQLSLALALGGLLIAILFSGLAFVMTRELPFLFFGVAMFGEIMLEAFRTGLLQRFFWPADWALPPQMAAVASMMAVLPFAGFFFTFVPKLPQYRLHYSAFWLAIALTVAAQLWSIGVNYAIAVQVWSLLVNVILIIGVWVVWLTWRSGFKPAGTLLLGFSCVLALELVRLVSLMGFRSFSQAEILLGPWALVLTTPVILMSVFHRSRDIHARLFQAENDNQAKIQFLSQMSHELRTPLDIILGNAQLLTRQATGSPLRQEFLDHIQQSGWHLLSMIDEILDYSRGVAGHLPIENARLDWPQFLRNLAHNAQVLADKNSNQFAMTNTADTLSHVVTDSKRLRQVLDNLLTNASKHTRGGSIHLDCAVAEHNGQWKLSFAVTDSGEGIALADQERIFLPFERGVNRTQAQDKGIGMGLAISRQLVEAMGGQLSVQSVPGQGACFRFWVMADKADELSAQAGDTMGGGLKLTRVSGYTGAYKSVLVIDNEAAIRQTLVNLLTDVGLQVHAADSGSAATKLLATSQPIDLILTDQFMENGDGWSVLVQVAVRWPILPVMLMSAAPPKRPENFPPGLDFAAHLLKPLDYQKLLLKIGELLHIEWVLQPDSQLDSSTAGTSPHEALTAQDRASLRTLIHSGQMSAIMAWAQDLKRRSPESAAMADELEAAARGLDMAALDRIST